MKSDCEIEHLDKIECHGLRAALAAGNPVDWLIANYHALSLWDRGLLSSFITSEERYAIMDAMDNKEGDPLKSLLYRDSQNIVPFFLSNLTRFACRDDYEKILHRVWVKGEYGQFSPEDWDSAFRAADLNKLRAAGKPLPKRAVGKDGKIIVFQGGNGGDDYRYNSWTLSRSVAIRFAWMKWRQFDENGSFSGFLANAKPTVYKATVSENAILMYTNARNEQEVVIKTDWIPTKAETVMEWDRAVDTCPVAWDKRP